MRRPRDPVDEAVWVGAEGLVEGFLAGGVDLAGLSIVNLIGRHQADAQMVMVLIVPVEEGPAEGLGVDPDGCRRIRVPRRVSDASPFALTTPGEFIIGGPNSERLAQAPANPYERMLVRIAFLAPEIQRDILDGRQSAGLTLERLMHGDIPPSWDEQRRAF